MQIYLSFVSAYLPIYISLFISVCLPISVHIYMSIRLRYLFCLPSIQLFSFINPATYLAACQIYI
jgi:hypothetical protein